MSLIIMAWLRSVTILAHKFPKIRKYVNGTPTIIMDNGKLYRKNMKKAELELSELCRLEGYFNINDIETAIYEYNVRITILPKSEKRPITPGIWGFLLKKPGYIRRLLWMSRYCRKT